MKTIMLSFCLMAVTINANARGGHHHYEDNRMQKLNDTTYVVKTMETDSLVVFKTPQEAIVFRNKDQARYDKEHENDGAWVICTMGLAVLTAGFLMMYLSNRPAF